MACHVSAGAQTITADSIADGRTLDGVTVTERMAKGRLSATAPTRVLDADAMLRLGIADIADALHRLPATPL